MWILMYLKVSTIDESVGRIIKTLKANGLYENTLLGLNIEITIICELVYWIYHAFVVDMRKYIFLCWLQPNIESWKSLKRNIFGTVFTSDNGSGYRPANLPLRGKKGSVFEVRPIGSSYSEKFQSGYLIWQVR